MLALLRGLARGDEAEAEELWQRAATRAWTYREALRTDRGASGWLRQIVFRVWLDERARRRRAPEVRADLEIASEPDAERGAIAREELHCALAVLRPVEREVLLRMHRDGESVADIATAMSMPINTVKSHAHRGRERMLAAAVPRRGRFER